VKQYDVVCHDCQTFKFFCSHCDNFVHNLPSKKSHKRSLTLDMSTSANNNNTSILEKNDRYDCQSKSPISNVKSTSNSFNNIQFSCDSQTVETKKYVNSTYSNEYMTELKNIYEKEKQELLFKNQTLQSHIDRLKNTFTEEVTSLQSELQDAHKKYSINVEYLEKENELKLLNAIREKDREIKELLYRINDLEQTVENAKQNAHETNQDSNDLKENFHAKIEEMNNLINEKEREAYNMKVDYERKIELMMDDFNQSRDDLIRTYENKVEGLMFENKKKEEKMENLSKEKEYRINKLYEKSCKDESYYNNIINELKNEIEDVKGRNKKVDFLEEEVISLRQAVEKYKSDYKYQYSELKYLESENKIMLKQNEEIKLENFRLEKLLYPHRFAHH